MLNRKFLMVEGIWLSYLEHSPADGRDSFPVVFFVHGNSGSATAWTRQLEAPELASYRGIAFDLPAHGDSGDLSGSGLEYSFPDLGRLIAGAVRELAGGGSYVIAGLSIGTNIVVESLAYAIKPAGIALIGSCIMGGKITMDKAFFQDVDLSPGFVDVVSDESLDEYARIGGFWPYPQDRDDFRKAFRMVKDGFRSRIFATVSEGRLSDETALLASSSVPVLVIYGKGERVCKTDALDELSSLFWNGQVYKIDGAGHFAQTDQPEACNRLLAAFAGDIFAADAFAADVSNATK